MWVKNAGTLLFFNLMESSQGLLAELLCNAIEQIDNIFRAMLGALLCGKGGEGTKNDVYKFWSMGMWGMGMYI